MWFSARKSWAIRVFSCVAMSWCLAIRFCCEVNELKLRGLHNVENVAAAFAAGIAAGASVESMAATAKAFNPVEHRLEFVAEIEGVRFYNDSKATSVDATLKALEALLQEGEGKIVLILTGGKSAIRAARFAREIESAKARIDRRRRRDDRKSWVLLDLLNLRRI